MSEVLAMTYMSANDDDRQNFELTMGCDASDLQGVLYDIERMLRGIFGRIPADEHLEFVEEPSDNSNALDAAYGDGYWQGLKEARRVCRHEAIQWAQLLAYAKTGARPHDLIEVYRWRMKTAVACARVIQELE